MTVEPITPTELALHTGVTDAPTILAGLLSRHKTAKVALAAWKKEEEAAYAAVAAFLGEHEAATLDGEQVVTFARTSGFRGADFAKAYPDLAKLFTRQVTKETLDVEWLRLSHPELYRAYQTRVLLNKYEPLPSQLP